MGKAYDFATAFRSEQQVKQTNFLKTNWQYFLWKHVVIYKTNRILNDCHFHIIQTLYVLLKNFVFVFFSHNIE